MQKKEKLIKKFNEIFAQNVKQNILLLKEQKSNSFKPLFSKEYYDSLMFNSLSIDDVSNIKLELVFCENQKDIDIFDYYRYNVSSMPQSKTPGRILRILVRDITSKKYLGIIQFSTDLLNSELKDSNIGINPTKKGRLKKHIRDNSANLSICVPLQPFGFNFCGGKLLAMLAFSKEIVSQFNNKYESNLAMISTTSIHGKSIQYDRLKELKYIGLTHGYGTCHIDQNFYEDCIDFIKESLPNANVKKMSKCRVLNITLQKLGLDKEYLNHGQQRGIYVGFTGSEAKQFLLKDITEFDSNLLKNIDDICEFWKKRWAAQRHQNISKNNQINSII